MRKRFLTLMVISAMTISLAACGKKASDDETIKKATETTTTAVETDEENATAYNGVCLSGPKFVCVAIKCINGMGPDSNGKCVTTKQDPQKKSCDRTAHGQTKTESCPSSILRGDLCKRTCNDGKWSCILSSFWNQ